MHYQTQKYVENGETASQRMLASGMATEHGDIIQLSLHLPEGIFHFNEIFKNK